MWKGEAPTYGSTCGSNINAAVAVAVLVVVVVIKLVLMWQIDPLCGLVWCMHIEEWYNQSGDAD